MGKHQQHLTQWAERCDDLAAAATHEADRAGTLLAALAAACRRTAEVFALDPTLESDPPETGVLRSVDLVVELTRCALSLLKRLSQPPSNRWERDEAQRTRWWEEAEAITERATQYAEVAQLAACADHATAAGSRAISTSRLHAVASDVAAAAVELRAALRAAANLPHRPPAVDELLHLADRVEAIAVQAKQERGARAAHSDRVNAMIQGPT